MLKQKRKFIFFVFLILLLMCLAFYIGYFKKKYQNLTDQKTTKTDIVKTDNAQNTDNIKTLIFPISNFQERVTKKPFGIYITPENSPIAPERFSGFHTGTDFETTADEQNIDIPIFAICQGPLALKKYASGYGGVAVQQCQINNEVVTVIYGHLKLSSIMQKTGATIKAGDQIALLGKGFSAETDGERKHLHLGIHKGAEINLLGYAQSLCQKLKI
ncbi:MAG: M23 family metallopeptidase [Candidatus Doudnabacteria bacterium]|nr:M23 family metallopeptidase [Candidatus Doudnabacteria bacterium]